MPELTLQDFAAIDKANCLELLVAPMEHFGIDVRQSLDGNLIPSLLKNLADGRLDRMLAKVDPAAGKRPLLLGRDIRRQPAEQNPVTLR